MIEDKPIDYKTEYNKTINKLVSLRQKHDGLKEDYDYIKSLADRYFDERIKLKKENEQLAKEKERYKRLSEIRREEINNRILTIKEFIENCSDNKVKKILKDLFHSEVKEYDLSAQNRKLLHENEQLKSDNFNLNKSVECLDKTVKEQCNKIDWADECGVRWEKEYEKWKR